MNTEKLIQDIEAERDRIKVYEFSDAAVTAYNKTIDIIRKHSEPVQGVDEQLIRERLETHVKYLDSPLTDSEKGLIRDVLAVLRPYLKPTPTDVVKESGGEFEIADISDDDPIKDAYAKGYADGYKARALVIDKKQREVK